MKGNNPTQRQNHLRVYDQNKILNELPSVATTWSEEVFPLNPQKPRNLKSNTKIPNVNIWDQDTEDGSSIHGSHRDRGEVYRPITVDNNDIHELSENFPVSRRTPSENLDRPKAGGFPSGQQGRERHVYRPFYLSDNDVINRSPTEQIPEDKLPAKHRRVFTDCCSTQLNPVSYRGRSQHGSKISSNLNVQRSWFPSKYEMTPGRRHIASQVNYIQPQPWHPDDALYGKLKPYFDWHNVQMVPFMNPFQRSYPASPVQRGFRSFGYQKPVASTTTNYVMGNVMQVGKKIFHSLSSPVMKRGSERTRCITTPHWFRICGKFPGLD